MKKILCFSVCLFLLLCTGCQNFKDVKKEPLNVSGFTAVMTTNLNGVTLTSNVNYDLASGFSFSFTSPKTLENTLVSGKEGVFTLTGEKLKLELSSGELPKIMICRAIYDCVNAVSGAVPIEENDFFKYSYSIDGTPCVLYTDKENNFQKLQVQDVEFIFDSFSYTTGT